MRILAALLVALPLAASAQYEPASTGYAGRRSPWYLAVGVGGGAGAYVLNGATYTFRDWNYDPPRSSTSTSFNFQIGVTMTDRVLLGFDWSLVDVTSFDGPLRTGIWVNSGDAIVTFFPQGEGFFVRGGAGFSSITFDDSDEYPDGPASYGGVNATAGIGYAFWLGSQLNLTVYADGAAQRFAGGEDQPSSSRTFALGVGLAWY